MHEIPVLYEGRTLAIEPWQNNTTSKKKTQFGVISVEMVIRV